MTDAVKIKERVREHYTRAVEGRGGCCSPASTKSGCCGGGTELVELSGYKKDELASLPEDAVQSSFGCGNPVAFAGVQEGQTIVDIGSGAGIDCLLAAERVGSEGRVIGLDMTPVMIERARANARKARADNVEFRFEMRRPCPSTTTTRTGSFRTVSSISHPTRRRSFARPIAC